MQMIWKFIATVLIGGLIFSLTGCLGGAPKQSGVFVTADAGITWNASPDLKAKGAKTPKVYPPLEATAVGTSPVDANLVVAGTADHLYLSTDGAKTWSLLTTKLPTAVEAIAVQSVRFHPTEPGTFYVTGVSAGYGKVLKSTDRGETLQDVFTVSRPGQTVTAALVDQGNGNVVYVGDQLGSLYRSNDAGASWRRIFSSQQSAVTALAQSGTAIFVGTAGEGVFRSTDGGATFNPAGGNLTDGQRMVWALTTGFSAIYAGTEQGPAVSRDFGNTWQVLGSPLPASSQRVQAAVTSGNNLYFATSAVVYRSSPDGSSFAPVQLKLAKGAFSLAASPSRPEVVYAAANNETANYLDRYRVGVPGFFQPIGGSR